MMVVFLLQLLLLFACQKQDAKLPDVIFITIDTLRRDHISAYSQDSPIHTPAIDMLVADSICFEQAWSPISVTAPAFCTVMTGLNPEGHGVVMNLFRGGRPLPDNIPTLAEALQAQDYTTAAFVSSFILRRELNLDRGFQVYEGPPLNTGRIWGNLTVNRALKWIRNQDSPFFLWIHLYDPHGPLKRWRKADSDNNGWSRGGPNLERIPQYQLIEDITDPIFYTKCYRRAVAFADAQVGRLILGLKKADRYERALIVFLADHGESFTERELWFDHGTTPFAEQLLIPLLIKMPHGELAGSSHDRLVSLADVAPSVMDILGISGLPKVDGVSLFASEGHTILVGESSHCKQESVLSCYPKGPKGKIFAARDMRWTLICEPTSQGPHWSLYDRLSDPMERNPLPADKTSELLRKAIKAACEMRKAMKLDETEEKSDKKKDSSEWEALRSLGYIK